MKDYRQTSVKKNLWLRARIFQAIRRFFIDKDYLEVETPCRIPAPAPEAHIDAVPSDRWFLQTSPELCMKRLLAAGYPRIFQICKCFRQQERGRRHLPEFTMLEWYHEGINYFDMMTQCEDLIWFVAQNSGFGDAIVYQGKRIDLKTPWNRMSVCEAFDNFASISMETAISRDRFDEVIACEIEPHLGQNKPLFLYDYPMSSGALARMKPDNPLFAERFELYICGLELCNAFTELTDPTEQRMRFEKEQTYRHLSGKQVTPMPEKFLNALKFMPEASGNALGIDRLVMLLADSGQIDDVTAFTPEEL
ncbi:EF-P lysine aminoacylase EpmA [Desulfonema magnum]|uniref:Elongation factor P--(R)-beta-lysine ligase n=1 Tax=Desulfonema magnum TaxID=45655 RepID=A0A975GK60_9BACT|nr:EF-P lysine aminoacylase EpmA [Desulfonema magnum]QTA84371.1 Elongation factor P--(R)-beta-lysine ligase [Desulfonema magnum]